MDWVHRRPKFYQKLGRNRFHRAQFPSESCAEKLCDRPLRGWARLASLESQRRSPTRSITRPVNGCAICRSRSINYSGNLGKIILIVHSELTGVVASEESAGSSVLCRSDLLTSLSKVRCEAR